MNPETPIQKRIMLACGTLPSVRVFRNNTGVAFAGEVAIENPPLITLRNYRRIKYGLCNGSSDLIGWETITITPDMVGRKLARFVALEVKAPTGRTTADQKNFINQVNEAGGMGTIIRDPAQVRSFFRGER